MGKQEARSAARATGTKQKPTRARSELAKRPRAETKAALKAANQEARSGAAATGTDEAAQAPRESSSPLPVPPPQGGRGPEAAHDDGDELSAQARELLRRAFARGAAQVDEGELAAADELAARGLASVIQPNQAHKVWTVRPTTAGNQLMRG